MDRLIALAIKCLLRIHFVMAQCQTEHNYKMCNLAEIINISTRLLAPPVLLSTQWAADHQTQGLLSAKCDQTRSQSMYS